MTVQELIDCGFVDFVDFKNGLFYLEFVYVNWLKSTVANYSETDYRIGSIVCDKKGAIHRATMLGYAFTKESLTRVFPQIISKSDDVNISDIYKIDENGNPYINVVNLRNTKDETCGSKIWTQYIKGNGYSSTKLYISAVATKEYFIESKEEFRMCQHFDAEHAKFKMLADSIKHGLEEVADATYTGLNSIGRHMHHHTRRQFGL